MNEYDSELVRSILAKAGYGFVQEEAKADVVMLNTCAVRENAHRKVYGKIHEIRYQRKREGDKPLMIGVLGCMATHLRKALLEDPHLRIDFIAGPDSYKKLPRLIAQAAEEGKKTFDVTLSEFETYADVYPIKEKGVSAWIAVMRGCNNFCTFCVVPYTRGRERSRSPENIVTEVEHLATEGFRQITLLGQNVNSYRYDGRDFTDLIEMVSQVEGLKRIRFTSPHPKDFPDRLLRLMAENPKVCQQIHLPLQAGSNRVLELMDRTYTHEAFLDLVARIRTHCPAVALSTDVIVGFPTETDEDFEDTVRVMQKVRFDSAFMFKYSERKNTIAARKFPDDVPEAVKTDRIIRLNTLQKEISLRKNQAHVGQRMQILIEEIDADTMKGRTDGNKMVIAPRIPSIGLGDLCDVTITTASPFGLKGIK